MWHSSLADEVFGVTKVRPDTPAGWKCEKWRELALLTFCPEVRAWGHPTLPTHPSTPNHGGGVLSPSPPDLLSQLPVQQTCRQSRTTLLLRLKFFHMWRGTGVGLVFSQISKLVQLAGCLHGEFAWWSRNNPTDEVETLAAFHLQLITSNCLLLPKGEVSLSSPTPTPPCPAPRHSPTPSHALSTGTQVFLQADLTHTGPRKPFQLICSPPRLERWFNSESASSES